MASVVTPQDGAFTPGWRVKDGAFTQDGTFTPGWLQELMALLGPCTPRERKANDLKMGEVFASNTVGGGATRQFRLWCTDGPPQGAFNMQLDSSRCTSPQAVTVCNRGCNPM